MIEGLEFVRECRKWVKQFNAGNCWRCQVWSPSIMPASAELEEFGYK